jgi:cytochrome c-type biogenesis protein CcmH/NrfF
VNVHWLRPASLGLLLALGTLTAPAHGETEAQRARRAREIIAAVNSPFCPASTLASCGSPQAAEWRQQIQQWVDEGLTKNEICSRLETRVGHPLCAVPRTPLQMLFPFALSLGAIAVLGLLLRRFVRAPPASTPGGDPPGDPAPASSLDADLDRELAELDDDRR